MTWRTGVLAPRTTTLYLIGEPGAGKSTLMAELHRGWPEVSLEKRPVRHVLWERPDGQLVPELGWPRATYPGTDGLAMDANRYAVPWIGTCGYPLVLAEGDRLANGPFFTAATEAGRLLLVHVHVQPELAAKRRALRGSNQDPAWLAGRRTKVANLLGTWPHRTLDGTMTPAEMAAELAPELL